MSRPEASPAEFTGERTYGQAQILCGSCTTSSLENQVVELHGHTEQRFAT
jgi:hypothetical protein